MQMGGHAKGSADANSVHVSGGYWHGQRIRRHRKLACQFIILTRPVMDQYAKLSGSKSPTRKPTDPSLVLPPRLRR